MDRLLAERYVPLARKLAGQAARRYAQDFEDVYRDALYGLTVAADRHQPELPFGRYASSCIVGEILHGVRDRIGFRAWRERGDKPPVVLSLSAERSGDFTVEDLIADPRSDPHETVERAELWRAVRRLPEDQRLVVTGYYRLGLSQEELAGILGCSQSAVWRTLVRARTRLKGMVS